MVDVVEVVPEKPTIGKAFKKEGKVVMDYLAQMDKQSIKEFEDKLTDSGWVCYRKVVSGQLACNTNILVL